MKKVLSLIFVAVLCLILCVGAFAAECSTSLTGPATVRAGDTITLTFSVNCDGALGCTGTLRYDPNQLTLVDQKVLIGGAWELTIEGETMLIYDDKMATPTSGNTALFSLTFQVNSNLATGTVVRVSAEGLEVSNGDADSYPNDAVYSVSIASPLSTDNTLKSLQVTNAQLTPEFTPSGTYYRTEVPFEVDKLEIVAEANDSKARVSVYSPVLVPDATGYASVTVTAENGSTKTYTIEVYRAQDPNYQPSGNNDLSGITVEGFLLSPGFSADRTQYVIWLPYEVDSVKISGSASDKKASVEVVGGNDLIAGQDNEIKVICTAENGEKKEYIVIAKRATAHGSQPTEPTEPSTPTEPSEPTKPSDPTQPSVPTEPTAPSQTTQPTSPSEATKPQEPTAPEQPQTPPQTPATGVPSWLVITAMVICLALGTSIGVLIGKAIGKRSA